MAFSKIIVAGLPLVALFLAGCGSTSDSTDSSTSESNSTEASTSESNSTEASTSESNSTDSTSSSGTTLSDDAVAKLVTWPDWNALPDECAYIGMDDIGKEVPLSCCTSTNASAATISPIYNGTSYDCFAVDLGNVYAKDFFGCVDKKPTIAEGCVPTQTPAFEPLTGANETAWPNPDLTAAEFYSQGDVDSCNCGYQKYSQVTSMAGFEGGFPSVYKGPGCFVALNYLHMYVPFMGMNASTAKSTLEAYSYNFAFFAHIEGSCQ